MKNTGEGISVHIHIYGILADYAGVKNLDIKAPGKISISAFVNSLPTLKPDIFKKEWMDPESGHSIVKVFRNGDLITPEIGRSMVEDGDDIRFFSAISGG